jgi:predicted enzyme related to lactoylglutathione lyase
MERAIGIGGIFFRSRDPEALAAWYRDNLGVELTDFGGAQFGATGDTVWMPFPHKTENFGPNLKQFMINYRVASCDRMVEQLRAKGAQIDGEIEDTELGKFAHAFDPEGNRFELWEPKAT